MNRESALLDLDMRLRQLEEHILRSSDYVEKVNQQIRRQLTVLYLSIAFLIILQITSLWRGGSPLVIGVLTAATLILAALNCLLLYRTKNYVFRLNKNLLDARERNTLEAIGQERTELEQLRHEQ